MLLRYILLHCLSFRFYFRVIHCRFFIDLLRTYLAVCLMFGFLFRFWFRFREFFVFDFTSVRNISSSSSSSRFVFNRLYRGSRL